MNTLADISIFEGLISGGNNTVFNVGWDIPVSKTPTDNRRASANYIFPVPEYESLRKQRVPIEAKYLKPTKKEISEKESAETLKPMYRIYQALCLKKYEKVKAMCLAEARKKPKRFLSASDEAALDRALTKVFVPKIQTANKAFDTDVAFQYFVKENNPEAYSRINYGFDASLGNGLYYDFDDFEDVDSLESALNETDGREEVEKLYTTIAQNLAISEHCLREGLTVPDWIDEKNTACLERIHTILPKGVSAKEAFGEKWFNDVLDKIQKIAEGE